MRAMSTLSHPNIAAIHDWGEEQVGKRTTVYAVVEYLAGGSLRDLFDRGRYLDPSQALVVGLEACRGLDFAHRKGLVHTELTPSKLVFGDDRRLRIVDFGLARLLGEHDWAEPATVATHVARYASPEQALGQPIDGKSDVYSLALILVEAVTGTVPFAARSTVATLSARVGRLMPVSADLGPLAAVLERAGRPEPADRSTAAELGRGLVRAAEKLPRPTPIPLLVTVDRSRTTRARCAGPTTRPAASPARRPSPSRAARPAAVAADGGRSRRRRHEPTAVADRRRRRPRPRRARDGDRQCAPRPSTTTGDAPRAGRRPRAAAGRPRHSPTRADAAARCTTATPTARSTSWPAARPAGGRRAAAPTPRRRRAAAVGRRRAGRRPTASRRARRPARAGAGWRGSSASLVRRRARRARLPRLPLFQVPTHEVPELVGLDEAAARAADGRLRLGDRRRARAQRRGARRRRRSSAPRRRPARSSPRASRSSSWSARARSSARCPTRRAAARPRPRPRSPSCGSSPLPADAGVRRDGAGRRRDLVVGARDPALVAGGEVLPDTEVALVVSTGPAPRTVPDARRPHRRGRHGPARRRSSSSPRSAEPVFSDDVADRQRRVVDARRRAPRSRAARTVTLVAVEGRRPRRRCPT